jgi:hypothetical protein
VKAATTVKMGFMGADVELLMKNWDSMIMDLPSDDMQSAFRIVFDQLNTSESWMLSKETSAGDWDVMALDGHATHILLSFSTGAVTPSMHTTCTHAYRYVARLAYLERRIGPIGVAQLGGHLSLYMFSEFSSEQHI